MLSFHFLQKGAGSDLEEEIDFRGGNVQVITSKESWDQKILEANKDGKIVSELRKPHLYLDTHHTKYCYRIYLHSQIIYLHKHSM